MTKDKCPICLTKTEVEHELKDVFIHNCHACKHRHSVLKDNITEEYDDNYYINKHKNWFNNPDINLYKIIVKLLSKRNLSSLLDIGCGNGNLLKYIKSQLKELQLTGIDLSSVQGFDDVKIINQSFLEYEWSEKYDVITSLATIEHIAEVSDFVTKVHSKLSKGGIFFVMTMNDDSILYRASRILKALGLRKSFKRLYDKHHINHFSHHSLKKLLKQKGFSIEKSYLHDAPLKSLDIEHSHKIEHIINKLAVIALFFIGRITKKTYLQSIVAIKS